MNEYEQRIPQIIQEALAAGATIPELESILGPKAQQYLYDSGAVQQPQQGGSGPSFQDAGPGPNLGMGSFTDWGPEPGDEMYTAGPGEEKAPWYQSLLSGEGPVPKMESGYKDASKGSATDMQKLLLLRATKNKKAGGPRAQGPGNHPYIQSLMGG